MRVLFVVNRCKKNQMFYIRSIARLATYARAIVSYVGHENVRKYGLLEPGEGIARVDLLHDDRIGEMEIDLGRFRDHVRAAILESRPDVIHCLYYYHDSLVVAVRDVLDEVGHDAVLIYETRDPTGIGFPDLDERAALEASDAYIFATEAIVDDLFARHLFHPSPYILVRQSEFYADRDAYPEKLSAEDGRAHIVLMGSFKDDVRTARHYGAYIDAFVRRTTNSILHLFPHLPAEHLEACEAAHPDRVVLHREDHPYPRHPKPERRGYTSTMGRFDFNLVAHTLGRGGSEDEMLRVCNPTKATSPLILADLPILCMPHYRGIAGLVEEMGCGVVYRSWDDLNELFEDRTRWPALIASSQAAAKRLCQESQAEEVVAFYRTVVGQQGAALRRMAEKRTEPR